MMVTLLGFSAQRRSSWLQAALRAVLLASVTLASWNCTPGDEGAGLHAAGGTDTTAMPEPGQDVYTDPMKNREPGALKTVEAVPVEGRTGPGGQPFEVARRTPDPPQGFSRQFGTITLDIALRTRTPDLSQYPCTSCH